MRSIYRRKKRQARIRKAFSLQLTSLMDALMMIVVFLLKSYSTSTIGSLQPPNMTLPSATAPAQAADYITISITRENVYVGKEKIASIRKTNRSFSLERKDLSATLGLLPLYEKLKQKKEAFTIAASRTANPEQNAKKWKREMLIQADKSIPYDLIKKIFFTSANIGYRKFHLVAKKNME